MKDYIYGKNMVANALSHNDSISNIMMTSSFRDDRIFKLLKEKHFKYKVVSNNEITKLVGNVVHQGIIAETESYDYVDLDKIIEDNKNNENALLVLLDEIEDPHNVGAILRSCDAFGVNGLIIGANRQVGLNSTVAKVSTGAIEYVPCAMVTNLNQAIKKLKDNGYWVVSTDGEATNDYRDLDYKMKTVLVVGSEGFGISKLVLKNSDFTVKIPMVGHVNSLNASVAAAILISEIFSKRNPNK
jgi:23S rRNA (guanosine2251-2'-O)-methyltransferase